MRRGKTMSSSKRAWTRRTAAVTFVAALLSAAPAEQTAPNDAIKVAVGILPQAYFVERVGGTRVNVLVLVDSGQTPHVFEPSVKQMAALSKTRVYFSIGVEFEQAVLPRIKAAFENIEVVDTTVGVPLRKLAGALCGDHGHSHDHDAAAVGRHDPHIWLNPRLVKIQAQTICDALVRLDPRHADEYRSNLAAFHKDLDRVHQRLAEALAPLKGRDLLVFHPAFGYFTDEFGLRQVAVEIEGKQPTARQLAQLIKRAKASGAQVIFVEPQFSTQSAEAVARSIDGVVVPLDPLARDYLANLERIAARIKEGLGTQPEPTHER